MERSKRRKAARLAQAQARAAALLASVDAAFPMGSHTEVVFPELLEDPVTPESMLEEVQQLWDTGCCPHCGNPELLCTEDGDMVTVECPECQLSWGGFVGSSLPAGGSRPG